MVLGLGHLRVIQTFEEDNWAMRPELVDAQIKADLAAGLVPIACVATLGTTSTCAFDPLTQIANVCKSHGVWVHVDAAYGGAYACLPELAHLFEGLELVDSFCVNCHKKLLCPFDLSCLYVVDRKPILEALSLQPEYLRNAASESGAVVDYEHWQVCRLAWYCPKQTLRAGVFLCKHARSFLKLSTRG
jgi:aromatic-L-amino-acid decarboxylase